MQKKTLTIKDISKLAGVSVASVSYVINGVDKVSEETKEKVMGIIESVGYKPNAVARQLAKKEQTTIGILMPITENYKKTLLTDNPFFPEFLSGAEYAARKNDKNLMIISTNEVNEFVESGEFDKFIGIIVIGLLDTSILEKLDEMGIPIILIDQSGKGKNTICIYSQNTEGAYEAVRYLLSLNHKKILFLSGELDNIIHQERFEGYQKAIQEHPDVSENVMITDVTFEGGVKAARRLAESKAEYDAIFCIADIMAIGLIKELTKQRIRVPDDLSVVGFDNIRMSAYFNPELSTVNQGVFEKAEYAVNLMVEVGAIKQTNKEHRLPVQLITRESAIQRN